MDWHIPDPIKTGTFFVQGRNHFYWYATASTSGGNSSYLSKIPGDINMRTNAFTPSGRQKERKPHLAL